MLSLSSPAEQVCLFSEAENPFQGNTEIKFFLSKPAEVELWVMNASGEKVETILNARLERGNHAVPYNATQLEGSVFFYFLRTRHLPLLKAVS
jgi:hypothetical protein